MVLVLDEAGDSATGEKYDSPPRGPGECCGCAPVCSERAVGGCGMGKLGGGCRRIMPANDIVLSCVPDRCRRLVLEAVLGMVPCMGL